MRSIEFEPMKDMQNPAMPNRAESPIAAGELILVGEMRDLAPSMEWNGAISAKDDQALSESERARYREIIREKIGFPEGGLQTGCMDGGTLIVGPKTAGGTVGNALRIMLASHADDSVKGFTYDEALEIAEGIDEKNGNSSGSHDLGQCGAYQFATHGIFTIAQKPEISLEGTTNFFGAVGHDFSTIIQNNLEKAAKKVASEIDQYVPDPEKISEKITQKNVNALPHLNRNHAEKDIAVILKKGAILDSGAFAKQATAELGRELNVFGYNWDYHETISKELGGSLGDFYLQSVTSQDVPILGQLTDGSLGVVAYK